MNWWKEQNFKSLAEASKFDASAFIPIGEILVGVGLKNDESSFQQFQNNIESYASGSSAFKQRLESEILRISPNVTTAWSRCISSRGMHI